MRKLKKWIAITVGVLLIAGILRLLLFTSCYIPNQGMEDSLKQGDHIIINKTSYGFTTPFSNKVIGDRSPKQGDIVLFYNPANTQAPLHQKEIYTSRCMGLPGDTLLVNAQFEIEQEDLFFSPDQKKQYSYSSRYKATIDSVINLLEITVNPASERNDSLVQSLSSYEYYLIAQKLGREDSITVKDLSDNLEYHFVIPKKGESIKVEPWNIALIHNTILLHERKTTTVKSNKLWVENQPVESYRFGQDYYWMVAGNSKNTVDSRQFGLVPQSHIIGKASFIWFSKDPNQGLFSGYRWNRIFQPIY
ncbi:signal peptidase I [Bacteroides propionicifaciens]|uniref:signal peptidase I n=1 Tax=Bacteroides propionicifaciens TaxID=392838 RepID=UPI000366D959|nr:signal peptidase I [Bacteroides propionicifaciens]